MRSTRDDEELLWELSRREEGEAPADPLDDAALAAWREGRLPEEEARSLETRLAADPAARARLLELAGLAASPPPAGIRARVLAATGGRPPARRVVRRWAAAAALAAAALVATVGLRLFVPPRLPEDLRYEVTAHGLAERRAPGAAATRLAAYPQTRVRVVVEPKGVSEAEVEFGLYRAAGGSLERLPAGEDVRLTARRGAAELSGAAAALAGGPPPGVYDLYLVVARPGDLPRRVRLDAGDDPLARLARGGRRRVHPLRLELLSPPSLENGP